MLLLAESSATPKVLRSKDVRVLDIGSTRKWGAPPWHAPPHKLPASPGWREAWRGRCNTFAQLCTEYIFRVALRQNLAMQL